MKNITTIKKTAIKKTTIAKITTTALLLFGIIHLDDELKSPRIRTSKKAGLVCGGESLFFHRG